MRLTISLYYLLAALVHAFHCALASVTRSLRWALYPLTMPLAHATVVHARDSPPVLLARRSGQHALTLSGVRGQSQDAATASFDMTNKRPALHPSLANAVARSIERLTTGPNFSRFIAEKDLVAVIHWHGNPSSKKDLIDSSDNTSLTVLSPNDTFYRLPPIPSLLEQKQQGHLQSGDAHKFNPILGLPFFMVAGDLGGQIIGVGVINLVLSSALITYYVNGRMRASYVAYDIRKTYTTDEMSAIEDEMIEAKTYTTTALTSIPYSIADCPKQL